MVRKSRSSISANRKLVKVVFLDGEAVNIETEVDSTLHDILDKACHNIGIVDNSLFGLAVKTDDIQPKFLDLELKIVKHATKGWKTMHQGVGSDGEPLFTVHLLVKYYVDKLNVVRDKEARNYYYKQLKSNFLDFPIMYPDDRCFLLATYSLISEDLVGNASFDPREFFPAWVVDKHRSKYIKEHLPSLLNDFLHLNKYEAQNLVVTALCHETPIGYNMHLYRMTKEATGKQHSTVAKHCSSKHCKLQPTGECLQCNVLYLGIGPKGVEVFEVGEGGFIRSLSHFRWNQIEKIHYTKRKLELECGGVTTTMYTTDEEMSKHVLKLCQNCHTTHIAREKEKIRQSVNKSFRTKYRESYIYSEDTEVDWKQGDDGMNAIAPFMASQMMAGDIYKKDRQNRYSIISDAASSTTSGIVSDRTCFSYYDSQEELLGGNKTITSSQDSLLEPSESFKCRPVQRATSEPSQKFEQLRELKVRQQHVPIMMSRATSDDTVRTSHKLADHIYENINEVRNRLMVASQSKPSKLSARARPSYSFSTKPTPDYNQNKLQVQSQGALNHSMGQLNQLTNMHAQPGFRSQYNIVKPSASMEQLLKDYQPPPSYNEKHKKVREQMLAAMSQEMMPSPEPKLDQRLPMAAPYHRKSSSDEAEKKTQAQQYKQRAECTCHATSYPEMDKLKDMSDLPMISALFNDKSLQTIAKDCEQCSNNNNNNQSLSFSTSRPFSWHSESFMLSSPDPAATALTQDAY